MRNIRLVVATAFGRLTKAALLLCTVSGLITLTIIFSPLLPWLTQKLAGDSHPLSHHSTGRVLVVLAHSVEVLPVGLVLDQHSYWLSEYAQTAYRQGKFHKIVIAGGQNVGTPVAAIMADLLQFNDVPADVIEIQVTSENMRAQAEAVRAYLGDGTGPIVLLASDYRMFRAARVFDNAGIQVQPLPLANASYRSNALHRRWRVALDLLGEGFHIADHWHRGWL